MRLLLLFLLLWGSLLSAQDRPLTYFSQVTFGNPTYGEIGKGAIQAADINGDSIADIAVGSHSTFQVGYGRIENGVLHFDMQAVDFVEEDFFSFGQLIDVDSDGDVDFTMKRSTSQQPFIYANYIFDNVEDTIQYFPIDPPLLFPQEVLLNFGDYNEDEITDAYYREGNDYLIMDGATGETHQPLPPSVPNVPSSQATRIDLNGDGMMDFYLHVDNFPNSDTIVHEVLINEGDFVFTKYGTRGFLRAENFGDFDGDGVLDVVGNRADGGSLDFRIKSNMVSADSAHFFDVSLNSPSFERSILPYDLNEDGYDDLVIFTLDTVYFCKNNQDQTFEIFNFPQVNPARLFFTTHPSWPNGTVVSEQGSVIPFLYHLNFDGTTFSVKKSKATIGPPVIDEPPYYLRITNLDTDMDGQPELGISSEFELVAAEFKNNAFQEYTAHAFDIPELPFFTAVASADFNNDSILDLVFALPQEPDLLQICYGQSDSTFSTPSTLAVKMDLCFKIGVGDFDGNGFIDFAASGGLGDNERFIVFLNQDGTQFIEEQLLEARSESWNIIDPNADGIADLAISINSTRIYMNDGQGSLDSTHTVSGRVIKSNDTNSPFIYTTSGNLIQIDADGAGSTVIDNANISFSPRTSYMLDYNLDGLPDLLYYEGDFQNHRNDSSFLVLTDTLNLWEVQVIKNRIVQGVQDINGDGREDVLWQIGSQLWVELVDTLVWTSIVEQQLEPLKIFPNPATTTLQFDNGDWPTTNGAYTIQIYNTTGQLVFSKKQNSHTIDISSLERGAYYLRINVDAKKMFGASFIRW